MFVVYGNLDIRFNAIASISYSLSLINPAESNDSTKFFPDLGSFSNWQLDLIEFWNPDLNSSKIS